MSTFYLPEGFTSRSATLEDVDIAAELFKINALATDGGEDINAEETRSSWQSPGFNPATDIHLVFANDGQLAAYVEVWANSKLPVHPFVWGCVHPDLYGKGLGMYITAWGEERCSQLIDILPADLRLAAHAVAISTNQPAHQLLKDMNWIYIRSFYTMRMIWFPQHPCQSGPMELNCVRMRRKTFGQFTAPIGKHSAIILVLLKRRLKAVWNNSNTTWKMNLNMIPVYGSLHGMEMKLPGIAYAGQLPIATMKQDMSIFLVSAVHGANMDWDWHSCNMPSASFIGADKCMLNLAWMHKV